MVGQGLDDLTVLVVNAVGDEGFCGDIEGYALPVLQDTAEADVFGLWGASAYDLFVVGRDGAIANAVSGSHPAEDHDELVEILQPYL